jgi:NlpC/P60 family putative phage cell wall peptidase
MTAVLTDVVTETRSWLQTPYQHRMSLKGVGCDCLGLVRGVWRGLYDEAPDVPVYSPDWAEVGAEDRLLPGLGSHFLAVGLDTARTGDVIAFRMKPNAVAKHVAILSAGEGISDPQAKIIHAYWGHAVVESWLGPFWKKCAVAAFRFPEKEEPPPPRAKRLTVPRPVNGAV